VEHVGADILGVIPDDVFATGQGGLVRGGLDVVIAGSIEVVLGADNEAELLVYPKASAPGAEVIRDEEEAGTDSSIWPRTGGFSGVCQKS
jgi:hypothetical protein